MNILRADHLGMCFGVRDAIQLARERARQGPLTVLGDLVHNETVLRDLRARGIQIVQQPAEAATRQVMITAHGASEKAIAQARALGAPLVWEALKQIGRAHV
jgi:4-hydroxy-3-methylbut-2-enyl diphosphate reductase